MIKCVISCPVDTYSGYGARARDFVKELIRVRPNWDISILSQRWGDTRRGYLMDHKEYSLLEHIIVNLDSKPDIWIQITVPNEFQPVGKYNIGVTAGIETTLCDVGWIEGCNRMNLVLVSSEHGKDSIVKSEYKNSKTGEEIKVKVPVETLFEGIDVSKYYTIESGQSYKSPVLKDLKNSWNFLCVGHWLQGDFGEDRKNIPYTVKLFLETFKDKEGLVPGLILKTSKAVSSLVDQEDILNRIYTIREGMHYSKSLPNIYLLHGDLTDEEMNQVYNDSRVKAMVSFTKGEGYGRPLAEFAAIGKPIICSGWSGQVDFLDNKTSLFIGGMLEPVHSSAVQEHMILAESRWFRPDDHQAVNAFWELYNNYNHWKKQALVRKSRIVSSFTLSSMGNKVDEIFQKYVPVFPEQVELKLPEV